MRFANHSLQGLFLATALATSCCAMADPDCMSPALELHVPAATTSLDAERAMHKLFSADQAGRNTDTINASEWKLITARDAVHRKRVLALLDRGEIRSAYEFFVAALVFQHGTCSSDYHFASELAQVAIQRGSKSARQLYALATDRYLLSIGRPQKYGTQFRIVDGREVPLEVDASTTDDERAQYDIPPLHAKH